MNTKTSNAAKGGGEGGANYTVKKGLTAPHTEGMQVTIQGAEMPVTGLPKSFEKKSECFASTCAQRHLK